MKEVSKHKAIYSFSRKWRPVEKVTAGEKVLLEVEDAFGGQVKNGKASMEELDWDRVNGATGPVFVEGAEPGDTLVVNVEEIRIAESGVIAVIPKQGALKSKVFKPHVKVVSIRDGQVCFDDGIILKAKPMIGTIGVAPSTGEVPTGSSGRHGGNMDVKELTCETRLYLPVFVEGALFAAGDLHAVQADGEACVSAVEVAGQIMVSFDVLKGKCVPWPVLETEDYYAFLVCGDSLDEAAELAVWAAVEALMWEYDFSFEEAYMLASLVVDLRINQVVDPKKGVRAVIPKDLISVESLCCRRV